MDAGGDHWVGQVVSSSCMSKFSQRGTTLIPWHQTSLQCAQVLQVGGQPVHIATGHVRAGQTSLAVAKPLQVLLALHLPRGAPWQHQQQHVVQAVQVKALLAPLNMPHEGADLPFKGRIEDL